MPAILESTFLKQFDFLAKMAESLALVLGSIHSASAYFSSVLFLIIALVCGAVLLRTESRNKTPVSKHENKNLPPEASSGFLGNALFSWVNSFIFSKRNETITLRDLPDLDAECSSAELREKFASKWAARAKPSTRRTLLLVVLQCIRTPLLYAVPSRLTLIMFRYAQPILIETTINFVTRPTSSMRKESDGRAIVLGTAVVYIGMALSSSTYHHSLNRMKIMVKSGLIGLIHDKVLSKRGSKSKQENEKAMTMVTTDVESLSSVAELIHETWAHFIEVVVGLYLLTSRIGWVSPVLLMSIFACSQMSRYVAKHLGPKQKAWNEATQTRMTATAEAVKQAKTVRMAGLTRYIGAAISALKNDEIETSKRLRWVMVYYNASANALGIFSPAIVLMLYALLSSGNLDAKTAFTATATLGLVTHPANMIMTIVPRAVAAQVGFERVQAFLEEEDMPDSRTSSSATQDPLVRFEDATIRYAADLPPVLRTVDLQLNRGTVTVCLGAVGTGKSALAKAILGEMDVSGGVIEESTRKIAVCTQTPWLPSGSIREGICGMAHDQELGAEWFDVVVRACCLDVDLKVLPDADKTQIGYCGMNLSGGQRQRVALARAVYSRLDLIVLDDPFSSLDRTTEQQILENLFGEKGLLRRSQTTSFLLTDSGRHCSYADHVVVLGSSGITVQGPRSSVKSDTFLSLVGEDNIPTTATEPPRISPTQTKTDPRHRSRVETASHDAKRKVGDSAVYRHYITSAGLTNCGILLACTASYSFFVTIPQYWLKLWTEAKPGSTVYFVSGYFLISLLAWTSTNGTMWSIHLRVAPTSGAVLHSSLLKTVLGAASSLFFEMDESSILNRFGQDIHLVDRELPPAMGNFCNQIFKLAMQLMLLFSVNTNLIAILPFGMMVLYLVQKVYLQKSRQLRLLDLEHRAGVYSSLLETTEGLVTIRAFGWEDACSSIHSRSLDDCQRPLYMLMCLQRWLNVVIDLTASAIAIAAIALLVSVRRDVDAAQVGIAFNMLLAVNTTLVRLIESWTNLEVTLGAVARLKQFDDETAQEGSQLETIEPVSSWPTAGAVSIKNLDATYNLKTMALQNCNLKIAAGQKIIIRGRTGSGKSTLLLALLRLVEPQQGCIQIDGLDTAKVPLDIVRERCFITVPQDPFYMPNLSLRFHVDPERTHSNDQIVRVLSDARLCAHFVALKEVTLTDHSLLDQPLNALPALSSGQVQLLSLARAALQSEPAAGSPGKEWHHPILLVDEATSSLDKETEILALELIETYFARKGLTVIMVTHKLDEVLKTLRRGVDSVVSMESGRIQRVEVFE